MKALIVILLATLAAGQDNGHDQMIQAFKSLDTDGDHQVTIDEMMKYFDKADADGDGHLTYQEYTAAATAQNPGASPNDPEVRGPFNYYDDLDKNRDNEIHRTDVNIIFSKLNPDKDTVVTQQEFVSEYPKMLADINAEIANLKTAVGK